jgi:hypothetical protein
MNSRSAFPLRLCASLFAGILAVQAVWISAAEIMRPRLASLPATAADAKAASAQSGTAVMAALVGWPRGGPWVDAAISENAALLADIVSGRKVAETAPDSLRSAERAAALAPADARAWVILAALSEQTPSAVPQALAQLKMSYYTAPYNEALFPLRLQIVARSPVNADEELRSYLKYEIETVIARKPSSKLAIAAALKTASPAGENVLQSLLDDLKLNPL